MTSPTEFKLYVLHEIVDAQRADELISRLTAEIGNPLIKPEFIRIRALDAIPDEFATNISAVLLPLLPDGFVPSGPQKAAFKRVRNSLGRDRRIIPVTTTPIKPPAPLDDLFAFPMDVGDYKQLAARLQNLLLLRVSSAQRRVFISYRIADGED